MQDPTQTTEMLAAADLVPNVEASPVAEPITTSDGAPAPRESRVRTIGLATLVGAIGIGALAIALVAGSPGNDAAPAAESDGSASRAAPIGAVSGWTAPGGSSDLRLNHGGRGGMRDGIGNAITITAIDGTKLALETDSGWTRMIDATGATVTKDGATVALSTLKVGDRIVFRETRGDDGTFTITAIQVIQPAVAGTVKEKSSSSLTLTTGDGSTVVIKVSSSTIYQVRGVDSPTLADVNVGDVVMAAGSRNADGSLSATVVRSRAAGQFGGPWGGPGDGFGGMPGDGFGRGGMRGGHGWGFPGDSDAVPAPSTAPTGSGTNG